MKQKSKEFTDFEEWCKDHTTTALYNGIKLAITNYIKSVNSEPNERRAIGNNEQKEKEFKPKCDIPNCNKPAKKYSIFCAGHDKV